MNNIQTPNATVSSLPVWAKGLFYLYLALLPLLSFWALFLDKSVWNGFIDMGYPISMGKVFYVTLSFVAIFLSGIFALITVQSTPLPPKLYLALFMLFDVPIQVLINSILEKNFNPFIIIINDFTIEIVGIVVAVIYLSFYFTIKKIKSKVEPVMATLIIVFGICILLTVYGRITWDTITASSFTDQIPFYTAIATTVTMYVSTFKQYQGIANVQSEQINMSKVASIAMIALWVSMVLIIFF